MKARSIILATAAALGLSGCHTLHDGYMAVKHTVKPLTKVTVGLPKAKTGPKQASADAEPEVVVASARSDIPTPARQIFNFHPNGSAWRTPVVLNPYDGPLAADVRNTARELREFNAQAGVRLAESEKHGCSETDVAAAKAGCGGAKAVTAGH